MGRMLANNLMNLGVYGVVKDGLEDLGIDINEIEAKASEYLGKTGESLDEIFSNANIARMVTGKIPDEVSSFLSELGLAL